MKNFPLWIVAVGLESCLLAIGTAAARNAIPALIWLMLASHLVYLVSVYRIHSVNSPGFNRLTWAWALVFRVTLLPLQPLLSEDVYRYRWEGQVQAQGGNPYLLRPEEDGIPGKGFRSGYGPLLTATEWANYNLAAWLTPDASRQAFWMKLPAVLADSGALLLLARAAPRSWTIYAWCPLPVIEFWWNGHNDAVPVVAVAGALVAARAERWQWAFAALGLAAGAKWWPAILWPLFAWRKPRWAWITPAIVAVSVIPYLPPNWRELEENVRFMSGFVGGWRNNDSAFGLLLWITGDPYRAKYLAFALLAGVVVVVLRWPLERASLGAIVALLSLAANCHPWYLSWLVPLLVFVPWPPAFIWMTLMPLAYSVLPEWLADRTWRGSTALRWWIYVPFYASVAVWLVYRRLGWRRKN